MKTCKDIKNNLSLYLDDSLADTDKKAVEEHIKTCPHCTKTLAQLSKTNIFVNSLTEVNPPPWLKYRIMANVKEEAEKKSFFQKLFYPLQIKIPVQIFATIFIAVLAVYLYRASEESTKEIVPSYSPAPVAEVQKSKLPEQNLKSSTDKAIQKEEQMIQKKEMGRDVVPAAVVDTAKDEKQQAAPDLKVDRHERASTAESAILPAPALEKKKEADTIGAAMKSVSAQRLQDATIKAKIIMHVDDLNAAADEIEMLLIKYDAQNINRHTTPVKNILSAQLKNQKIKDFMVDLKTIGQIAEGNIPASDNAEENIPLMIEISE